jgi:thioester reductase-like protein
VPDTVLLTGLPTLLARRLAREVLAYDGARVVAVVRPALIEGARAFASALPAAQRARLTLLEGDVVAIDFGLSGAELRRLARDVTVVHHAAHARYVGVEPQVAETLNVRGTREAIEVARALESLRVFVQHSTAYVSGDRRGLVLEEELERGQRPRNAVETTMLRAEKIVRAASDRLPTIVVRPTTIVGDATTGEIDRLDGPYLLLSLLLSSPAEIALPHPTDGDAHLHLVPVDHVARASVALSQTPSAVGMTFHLTDPRPLTARQTFDLFARAAGRRVPRGAIPAQLAKALLRTPGLDRFARSPRAFLDQLATPVVYSTRNADAVLSPRGLTAPSLESYVDAMVAFVRDRQTEQRRRRVEEPEIEDDPLV